MSKINEGTLWEKDSKWLRESRKDLWNPDYFTFLVKHVWKIDKAMKIVDFGCGIGYLASVLLPLLPEGSTYTGLDISGMLLEEARAAFKDSEWQTEFIEQDLTEYVPEQKYDIAICQSLLIHIPSPASILEKMMQSVISGGRVICIEPNWAVTTTGVSTYRHGMEVLSYYDWGLCQKLLEDGNRNSDVDRYIGIKIPAIMHDLGLKNIDIRVNDKATFNFREPDKKTKEEIAEKRSKPYYQTKQYTDAGLTDDEAKRHIEGIIKTEDFEDERDEPLLIVGTGAWLVSFGEK